MKRIPSGALAFALLWALAFLLPPVREIKRALFFAPTLMGANYLEAPKATGLPLDDPITIEWNLGQDFNATKTRRIEALNTLDALAARFPDQLWIAAARLRRTLNPAPRFDTGTGTPPAKASDWLDLNDLKRAALVAANAGKREPDNAFWPWMEAIFRFSLRQNEAGAACIERAGHASRFDDFVSSTTRARIALWEKHGDPLWEQKLGVWAGTLFTHLSPMRDAARATALQSLRARKRGDNSRALVLGAAVLDATRIWRRDSQSLIGALVAEASGRESLDQLLGLTPRKTEGSFAQRLAHGHELQKAWGQFARAGNRLDLVHRADWIVEPSIRGLTSFLGGDIWGEFGLPASQGRLAAFAPVFLLALAALCFFMAFAWLVGALATMRSLQNGSPSRGQVAACANFGFCALAGVLALGIKTGWLFGLLQPLITFNPEEAFSLSPLLCAGFVAGCWLLPVTFLNWKRERRFRWIRPERETRALPRHFGRARVFAWLMFLIFAVVVASNGRGLWDDTPLQLPVSASIATASLLCAVALEVIRFRRGGRMGPRLQLQGEKLRSSAPLTLRMARMGAWLVASLCLFSAGAFATGEFELSLISEALSVPLGLAAIVLAVVLGRKIGSGDGFVFRLATRSAGVLALAWSVVFVGLALVVWPLRVELNRQLDRRLEIGEISWTKEQIAKNQPPSPATKTGSL